MSTAIAIIVGSAPVQVLNSVALQARGPLGSAGPGVGGAVSGIQSIRADKTRLATEVGAQPCVASIGQRVAPARIAAARRIGMSFTVLQRQGASSASVDHKSSARRSNQGNSKSPLALASVDYRSPLVG
jgi:hypothetical protein